MIGSSCHVPCSVRLCWNGQYSVAESAHGVSSKGVRAGTAATLALRSEDRVSPERSVRRARPEVITGTEPKRRRAFLLLVGVAAGSLAAGKPQAARGFGPAKSASLSRNWRDLTPWPQARGRSAPSSVTILNAPMEVTGDWGKSLPSSAATVISRMREACLAGVRLLSDQQPSGLRVEDRTSGPPYIWLHNHPSRIAWIRVDVRGNYWCQLAYQFGHELGHVLDNLWGPDSKPRSPCQWLEEDLAEAFSLRGLGELADSWEQRPVFNDAPYANSIRQYRRNVIENYEKIASSQIGDSGVAAWFREYRTALEKQVGFPGPGSAVIPSMLHELEADPRSIEDIGAMNRWPEKTGVPIEQYMRLWERSCGEIGASGGLPKRIVDLLGLPRADP